MALTVKVYQCSCDRTHANKANFLGETITFDDVILKQPTSVTDPVLLIRSQKTDAKPFTPFHNYLFIYDFTRYYFINEIISVREDLWEVHCHVDVLYSFYDVLMNPILDIQAVIARQENSYNDMITDEQRVILNSASFTRISGNSLFAPVTNNTQLCCVLTSIVMA